MKALMASILLWLGTLFIVYWIFGVLGLSTYTDLQATDQKSVPPSPMTEALQQRLKILEGREQEVAQRERTVEGKDKVLREQLSRYESEVKRLEALNIDLEKRIIAAENEKHARELEIENKKAKLVTKEKDKGEDREAKKREEALHQARLSRLMELYEKMETKKAGKIFDSMEIKLASDLIRSMRQEKAAGILAQVSTTRAKKITEIIATVNSKDRQLAEEQVTANEPEKLEDLPENSIE